MNFIMNQYHFTNQSWLGMLGWDQFKTTLKFNFKSESNFGMQKSKIRFSMFPTFR